MPLLSDTMTEGKIISWNKKVGDKVKADDVLADVETDKATMELENYVKGTLLHIGIQAGDSVPVDAIIAVVGEKGEALLVQALEPLREPPRHAVHGGQHDRVRPEQRADLCRDRRQGRRLDGNDHEILRAEFRRDRRCASLARDELVTLPEAPAVGVQRFERLAARLAFGFIGLFIGPTLLAVAYSLLLDWTRSEPQHPPRA